MGTVRGSGAGCINASALDRAVGMLPTDTSVAQLGAVKRPLVQAAPVDVGVAIRMMRAELAIIARWN